MESLNYGSNKYLSSHDDELHAKNWNMNQIRMNQSLNDFMKNVQSSNATHTTMSGLEKTDSDDYNNSAQVNPESTTAEFKKYLDELKKNYLEKLTFSCPPKLTESRQSIRSQSDIINANSANNLNIRRSLYFDNKLDNLEEDRELMMRIPAKKGSFTAFKSDTLGRDEAVTAANFDTKLNNVLETPELTKSQILSRLIQIREYLKQSYKMLSTLQDSNDLINYASQMNKLHSLIEHLKDQEKGYMDLLKSFSKFRSLNASLTSPQRDALDLTDLNDSTQNKIYTSNKSIAVQTLPITTAETKIGSICTTEATNTDTEGSVASMGGSFISDTLTLNGVKCNEMNNLLKVDKNNLMVVGSGLSTFKQNDKKQFSRESSEDRTENDLDILDENTDDLATLEQLKEQKNLLKSIRLRKEELKALEGRRVALEALKRIANDSEAEIEKAFNNQKQKNIQGGLKGSSSLCGFNEVAKNSSRFAKSFEEITDSENNATDENDDDQDKNKEKQVAELCKFLAMLKEKQAERSREEERQNEANSIKQQQSLVRKTFKQAYVNDSNDSNNASARSRSCSSNGSVDGQSDKESDLIEPSSQIEKSKKTVRHFEELIRSKNNSLLRPKEQELEELKQELSINERIDEDLIRKMKSLAENEKKLEDLYTMQSRLSQLKNLISDFDSDKTPTPQQSLARLDKIEQSELSKSATPIATCNHFNLLTNEYRKSLIATSGEEKLSDETPISKFLTNSAFGIRKEFEQIKEECNTLDIEQQTQTSDNNRSEMLDQKAKLAVAKERLKQLQELIGKLKDVSSGAETTQRSHQLEQKEAAAALEVLNELEKQKQRERLEELKRNKLKLLELLKEKEAESAELAKLCTAYKTTKDVVNTANKEEEEEADVEDRFETAENDFEEVLSVDEEFEHNASPSDLLWSQMKRQLKMRENLRNKKQELEELIRVENKEDVEEEEEEKEENNEDNKIINCYREFLLKNKLQQEKQKLEDNNSGDEDEEDEEDIIMKRYIPNLCPVGKNLNVTTSQHQQQENVCTADELIQAECKEVVTGGEVVRDMVEGLEKQLKEIAKGQEAANYKMESRFVELIEVQNKMLTEKSGGIGDFQANMNTQVQFQIQMQVQQMMFNISSIFNELNMQRTELSQCKEQMNLMNLKIVELTDSKPSQQQGQATKRKLSKYTPPGVNLPSQLSSDPTTVENSTIDLNKRPSSTVLTNALPSYLYSRHQQQENQQKYEAFLKNSGSFKSTNKKSFENNNDYEDDFEDFDENESENQIADLTITHASKNGESMKDTFSNNAKYQPNKYQIDSSSSASTKSSVYSSSKNSSKSSFKSRTNFEEMREKIYAEVANLISQNETRPFYLIQLFKELQYLKEKNARDQVLKSIFNIANRQTYKDSGDVSVTDSNKGLLKKQTLNDEDDLLTYRYRMKKFNSMNKTCKGLKNPRRSSITTTGDESTNFETSETNRSSRSHSPENDSLSNTVIFVKNPTSQPQLQQKEKQEVASPSKSGRSSGSSILGIQDTYLSLKSRMPKTKEDFFVDADEIEEASGDSARVDQKNIEDQVKNLVSQIIKLIKTSSENEYEDEEGDSDDEPLDGLESGESNFYRHVKCDGDYINEIIDKVISVLKQSNGINHTNYLRLYQGQLCAYLKEALTKYENKRLVKCMEDILIDISDILCNELTFYSIMNCSNLIKPFGDEKSTVTTGSSLNLIKSLAANKSKTNLDEKKRLIENKLDMLKQEFETIKNQSAKSFEHVIMKKNVERSESSVSEKSEPYSEEIYYFDDNHIKRKLEVPGMSEEKSVEKSKIESNYSDILGRLKMILNEKTDELNCMMALSEQLKERNEAAKRANFNAVDSADEEVVFYSPINDTSTNEFKLKLLKYSTTEERVNKDPDTIHFNNDTDTDAYTDADSDSDNNQKLTASRSSKINRESNEITIDDLPDKMSLALEKIEQSTKEINIGTEILDRIIMESISDGFSGDGEALPEANKEKEESGDDEQAKSESSSGSDNFVFLSKRSCSDQAMIESSEIFASPNMTVSELTECEGATVCDAMFV